MFRCFESPGFARRFKDGQARKGGIKPPLRPPGAPILRINGSAVIPDAPQARAGIQRLGGIALRWMPAYAAMTVMLCLAAGSAFAQNKFPGIGRAATPAEIAKWDIDVRPDFTGLPKGSGSVKKGEEVWVAKCASCHGDFGEANHTFAPIVGGTTRADIERGRVAALRNPDEQRTTMMKLSRISTLWDYVNRAMPWNAAKTLTVEEVYAVTAYILNLAEVVPEDFVLSAANIAEVQKRLPNRDGLRPFPDLWNTRGRGDVRNTACMKDCPSEMKVASQLPEYARDAHGNIAEQNRPVGAVRGAETVRGAAPRPAGQAQAETPASLAKKFACAACHNAQSRVVGPSYKEIADKYRGDTGAEARLITKVKAGGAGVWGSVPMPPNPAIAEGDIRAMVRWILEGAP